MAAVLSTVLAPDDALREARELLAAVHDMPRHWPTLEQATPVSADEWGRALHAAERRASGAPLQYAAGRASFRHLTLDVDERVLIPRPETELLIDIVLDALRGEPGGIAVDVGTGSGAIALALANEGQFDRVIGTFQAVGHRMADCYVDNEAIRLSMLLAASLLNAGAEADKEVAVAKYWASYSGSRVGHADLHLHGGISIDLDYSIHRYFLWSKQIEFQLGAAGPQLARIGAILADDPVPA